MTIERRQQPRITNRQGCHIETSAPVSQHSADLEIDLALIKRDTAHKYRRKRLLLRAMVNAGLLTPEAAREHRYVVNELRVKWRAARALLRNGCALLKEG